MTRFIQVEAELFKWALEDMGGEVNTSKTFHREAERDWLEPSFVS